MLLKQRQETKNRTTQSHTKNILHISGMSVSLDRQFKMSFLFWVVITQVYTIVKTYLTFMICTFNCMFILPYKKIIFILKYGYTLEWNARFAFMFSRGSEPSKKSPSLMGWLPYIGQSPNPKRPLSHSLLLMVGGERKTF